MADSITEQMILRNRCKRLEQLLIDLREQALAHGAILTEDLDRAIAIELGELG